MARIAIVSPKYFSNPDVVLREEDPDGGLLFNPDTNQVKVLNHTGLFVWKLCDGKHDLEAIVSKVQKEFESVPQDLAGDQIKTFVNELIESGFIGIVEE